MQGPLHYPQRQEDPRLLGCNHQVRPETSPYENSQYMRWRDGVCTIILSWLIIIVLRQEAADWHIVWSAGFFSFFYPVPRYGTTYDYLCTRFCGLRKPCAVTWTKHSTRRSRSYSKKNWKIFFADYQHLITNRTCYAYLLRSRYFFCPCRTFAVEIRFQPRASAALGKAQTSLALLSFARALHRRKLIDKRSLKYWHNEPLGKARAKETLDSRP